VTMHDLRHDAGHHQGHHRTAARRSRSSPRRQHPRPREPVRTSVNSKTDEVVVRENELITVPIARQIEALGLEKIQVRQRPDLRGPAGRLPAAATAWICRRARSWRRAWPSASSPPRASANRARSSRCGRSTSAASVSGPSKRARARRRAGTVQLHPPANRAERVGRADRARTQRRDRDHRRQGQRTGEVRHSRRCDSQGQGRRVRQAWHRARAVDSHSIPILSEVGRPVSAMKRMSSRVRRSASGEGSQRPHAANDHGAQGRLITRRSCSKTRSGKILEFYYLPREGLYRGRRGRGGEGRSRPRRRRPARHPARRTSPAACRG